MFNQFEEVYDITELALKVERAASELGLSGELRNVENPRLELEDHFYRPDHQHLLDLGYSPSDVDDELRMMLDHLAKYRHRIEAKRDVLIPDVRWDGTREKSRFLDTVDSRPPGARFKREPATPATPGTTPAA